MIDAKRPAVPERGTHEANPVRVTVGGELVREVMQGTVVLSNNLSVTLDARIAERGLLGAQQHQVVGDRVMDREVAQRLRRSAGPVKRTPPGGVRLQDRLVRAVGDRVGEDRVGHATASARPPPSR